MDVNQFLLVISSFKFKDKGSIAGYDNQSTELIVYESLPKVKVFSTSIIAIIDYSTPCGGSI